MSLLTKIKEFIHRKHQNFELFNSPKELMKHVEDNKITVLGSWNRLYFQSKKIYLMTDPKYICTPSDMARQFILDELEILTRKRLNGGIYSNHFDTWFPQIAIKGIYYKVYHIDIKSCFYFLYAKAGIDCSCEIFTNLQGLLDLKFFGWGELRLTKNVHIAELETDKLVRNTIFGITLPTSVLRHTKSKGWYQQPTKTNLTSLGLKNFINFFLHRIVSEVIDHVYYWNIDGGYIDAYGFQKISHLLDSFNVKYTFELLEFAEIQGLGIYYTSNPELVSKRIGAKGSNHFSHIPTTTKHDDLIRKILE